MAVSGMTLPLAADAQQTFSGETHSSAAFLMRGFGPVDERRQAGSKGVSESFQWMDCPPDRRPHRCVINWIDPEWPLHGK
jgi:hypothetical protein